MSQHTAPSEGWFFRRLTRWHLAAGFLLSVGVFLLPGLPATRGVANLYVFEKNGVLSFIDRPTATRFQIWSSPTASPLQTAVCFSPGGDCTEVIVRELAAAQQRILVQAYYFTSVPIATALTAAHKRGVTVTVVLDESNQMDRYSAATFLANAGIPTWIDGTHTIAHNKVMIVDEVVMTGSFNFTGAADTRNAENLLILKHAPEVRQAYEKNFQTHLDHSHRYEKP